MLCLAYDQKKRRGWGSPFPSGSGCLVISCSFYFSPMKAEQLLTASEVGDNMGTETKRLAGLVFVCFVFVTTVLSVVLLVCFQLFFYEGELLTESQSSKFLPVNLTGKRFLP